jgi:hypothetical protein
VGVFEKEGLCLPISGEEEDYLRFVDGDHLGICSTIVSAGGESVRGGIDYYFETLNKPGRGILDEIARRRVDEWRKENHATYPPLMRVKIRVEVEYATDEETEQYWNNLDG